MRSLSLIAGFLMVSTVVVADEPGDFDAWLAARIAAYQPSTAAVAADQSGSPERWTDASIRNAGETLARRIWPVGDLPAAQLEWFCGRLAAVPRAHSLVYLDVRPRSEGERVVLSGATNVAVLRRTMTAALHAVGFEQVENQMRALPDRETLGPRMFGVCRVAHALTYDRPGGDDARLQTDLLYGEPVWLLDAEADHLLVHAGDGYWGWVVASAIERVNGAEFDQYLALPVAVVTRPQSPGEMRIPAGARVRLEVGEGRDVRMRQAEGGSVELPAAAVEPVDTTAVVARRIRQAFELLEVPYVFGGRSADGIDCSGFVTNILGQTGAAPARDAWQQALAGQLVATGDHRVNIRAGDLLYFINATGHIHHTALAISATHFIHASPPSVRLNSLNPDDGLYSPRLDRQFFMAKRR